MALLCKLRSVSHKHFRMKVAQRNIILVLVLVIVINFILVYFNSTSVVLMMDDRTETKIKLNYAKRKYAEVTGKVLDVDSDVESPTIFVLTGTYPRLEQKAELTRLCNTLLLVPKLHWIIVEDAKNKTDLMTRFLHKCGVEYTHLNIRTPEKGENNFGGRVQRNLGLQWLRDNAGGGPVNGVIFIADDDNSYSPRLFDRMRNTKRVSVWPVGFAGGLKVEKPKVELQNGEPKVVGWDVEYAKERKFGTDMAGFAINYNFFLSKPKAEFYGNKGRVPPGHEEDEFLKTLVSDISELEPKISNEVLVWHTQAKDVPLGYEAKRKIPSDADIEV